jgi:hypothetical protein
VKSTRSKDAGGCPLGLPAVAGECSRVRQNHDGSPEKGWFVCNAVNGEIKRRFVEFCPNEQEARNADMLDR